MFKIVAPRPLFTLGFSTQEIHEVGSPGGSPKGNLYKKKCIFALDHEGVPESLRKRAQSKDLDFLIRNVVQIFLLKIIFSRKFIFQKIIFEKGDFSKYSKIFNEKPRILVLKFSIFH